MVYLALRTLPLPDIEGHFLENMPAVTTTLGRRKPAVNFDQLPAIPTTLVIQLTNVRIQVIQKASKLMLYNDLGKLWQNLRSH